MDVLVDCAGAPLVEEAVKLWVVLRSGVLPKQVHVWHGVRVFFGVDTYGPCFFFASPLKAISHHNRNLLMYILLRGNEDLELFPFARSAFSLQVAMNL